MISSLAEQNKDFASELQKMFGRTSAGSGVVIVEHVADDVVKTEDIHPPKTGISVHFCVLSLMAMQN